MPLTRQQKKSLNITDLEAYTMATEEAIDAKFEDFETRMEEKICTIFAELSISRPLSPRNSQQGETSNRREELQERGGTTTDPYNPRMRVDFPRREERDPISWISKGRRLVIEPVEVEDIKLPEESLKSEEVTEEEPQPADFTVHALAGYSNPQTMKVGGLLKHQSITVLIDTGSTNNFLNSKVAARMALQIESCNKFNVEVTDGRILKCAQLCPQVKLLLQDQEVVANFFLLPINDYKAVLEIEWLTTLGDIS
ncbi:hypothetical protein BHM03_00041730 [Ensete ventricosum]|nr:hypothetical protein BHM03_00041730 [Ensete ventricosum]